MHASDKKLIKHFLEIAVALEKCQKIEDTKAVYDRLKRKESLWQEQWSFYWPLWWEKFPSQACSFLQTAFAGKSMQMHDTRPPCIEILFDHLASNRPDDFCKVVQAFPEVEYYSTYPQWIANLPSHLVSTVPLPKDRSTYSSNGTRILWWNDPPLNLMIAAMTTLRKSTIHPKLQSDHPEIVSAFDVANSLGATHAEKLHLFKLNLKNLKQTQTAMDFSCLFDDA
jgi:hypothetical protein